MLHESVRDMTGEERSSLEQAVRLRPRAGLRYTLRAIDPEAKWLGMIGTAVLLAAAATVGRVSGGATVAMAAGGLFGVYQLARALRDETRMRRQRAAHDVERERDLARILEDGRATVKRVRAVAVVELQPFEDEGNGYLFDLSGGRVLFLKGQDYDTPDDEDAAWPNTEFELVRTVVLGRLLALTCHGRALPPVRILRSDELDGEQAWGDREEVLDLSLDEAVKMVLRAS